MRTRQFVIGLSVITMAFGLATTSSLAESGSAGQSRAKVAREQAAPATARKVEIADVVLIFRSGEKAYSTVRGELTARVVKRTKRYRFVQVDMVGTINQIEGSRDSRIKRLSCDQTIARYDDLPEVHKFGAARMPKPKSNLKRSWYKMSLSGTAKAKGVGFTLGRDWTNFRVIDAELGKPTIANSQANLATPGWKWTFSYNNPVEQDATYRTKALYLVPNDGKNVLVSGSCFAKTEVKILLIKHTAAGVAQPMVRIR